MKHGLIILLLGLCSTILNAQEVISAAGGQGQNTSVQLNWTIGEPVIGTLTNANNALTQGVNQGTLSVTAVYQIKDLDFNISVYPNPTTEFINLIVDDNKVEGLKYYLHDTKGNLLLQKKLESQEAHIFMHKYMPGSYFLTIVGNNKKIKTFKIIKK